MLDGFIQWYYDEAGSFYPYTSSYVAPLKDNYRQMFDRSSDRPLISASNLGDPDVVLILKKLGFKPPSRNATVQDLNFLYTGFEVESRMIAMLKSFGAEITQEQAEVGYGGYTGHIDGLLNGELVFDVKAVKNANFNRMTGKKPYISNRYQTQLAFYKKALNVANTGLLVYNRDTSDIAFIDLSEDTETANDLDRKINLLSEAWSLDRIFENEEAFIPAPDFEYYQKVHTGNYLVPDSLKYSGFASVFYELGTGVNGYGKPQTYVIGYKSLEEAKQELESWQSQ